MSLLGNLFGLDGGRPKSGNKGAVSDHSKDINDNAFNRPSGLSSSSSRFASSRQSSSGGIMSQNSRLRAISGDAAKQNSKLGATAKRNKIYFGAQNSEKLKDIAPDLVKSFKELFPDSFSTREKSKEAISRILGAGKRLSADSYVNKETLRGIQQAIKNRSVGHPLLKGLNSDEIKAVKYAPYERKQKFTGGIKNINPKRFGV